MPKVEDLQALNSELTHLNHAITLMTWDQEIYLPKNGQHARAQAIAHFSKLYHQTLLSDKTKKILQTNSDLDETQTLVLKELQYQHDRAAKIPDDFVALMSQTASVAYHAWVDARKAGDFSVFSPHLAKVVDQHKQLAQYLGFEDTPYDALLNQHERDMRTKDVEQLFATAKPRMIALLKKITGAKKDIRTEVRHRTYPLREQKAFNTKIVTDMGFSMDCGRLDKTVHPFMIRIGSNDVRITYRGKEDDILEQMTTLMHEAGHALYEQGFGERWKDTVMYEASSTAIHESQSRTWENIIGRSQSFWDYYFPQLQAAFPEQLRDINPQQFVALLNEVKPGFIRVESDELTYNFHIFLRFEIEKALIEGTLSVDDVPRVWNQKMQEYLGITPHNDQVGCLQDVHWAHGIGYFSTYTLGNMYAAQFMHKTEQDIPDLWKQISNGNLKVLREWQREHIHQHCNRYTPTQLCEKVTGDKLDAEHFIAYLEAKYGNLYRV